jgi:RimJ/RimL family protein N-acetyltransferase
MGYWISEYYWGKEIAIKAVELRTQYGVNQLNFVRIHMGVFEHNTTSMKVLEKNEYEKDNVFKKATIKSGKILDEHRYSILQSV